MLGEGGEAAHLDQARPMGQWLPSGVKVYITMENLWKIYGNSMENLWKIYGKSMTTMENHHV